MTSIGDGCRCVAAAWHASFWQRRSWQACCPSFLSSVICGMGVPPYCGVGPTQQSKVCLLFPIESHNCDKAVHVLDVLLCLILLSCRAIAFCQSMCLNVIRPVITCPIVHMSSGMFGYVATPTHAHNQMIIHKPAVFFLLAGLYALCAPNISPAATPSCGVGNFSLCS